MRTALILASALLLPNLLFSQASRMESSTSRGDVFFGAAFNGDNPSTASTTGSGATTGFLGGADFPVLSFVGAEAQVGFSTTTNGVHHVALIDFLAGPRVQARTSGRVAPFADFLLGVQTLHDSNTQHTEYYTNGSGFATAGDAGADIRLTRRIALRPQAGFVFSEFAVTSGGGPIGNYRWRAAASLVYRF